MATVGAFSSQHAHQLGHKSRVIYRDGQLDMSGMSWTVECIQVACGASAKQNISTCKV